MMSMSMRWAQEAVVNAYLIRELWLAKWHGTGQDHNDKRYGRDRLPLFQGIGTLRRKSGMYGRNDGWANFSIDVCVVEDAKKERRYHGKKFKSALCFDEPCGRTGE